MTGTVGSADNAFLRKHASRLKNDSFVQLRVLSITSCVTQSSLHLRCSGGLDAVVEEMQSSKVLSHQTVIQGGGGGGILINATLSYCINAGQTYEHEKCHVSHGTRCYAAIRPSRVKTCEIGI